MTLAIQTNTLTRLFREQGKTVGGVHELSLAVPRGAIYGFLGPNGAGKTTTIRLLLGLLRAQSGEILLCGQPLSTNSRSKVAALVESPSLYNHLSGHDNLEVSRRLLGVPRERVAEALARVDLGAAATRRASDYSLGMRQRLGLALCLLGRPEVLILDEPGNGLDPAGVLDLRRMLQRWSEEGMTILISTHQLSEIEQVATHVGVLSAGRLIFQGAFRELCQQAPARLELDCEPVKRAESILRAAGETVQDAANENPGTESGADALAGTLVLPAPQRSSAALNKLLVQGDCAVSRVQSVAPNLEQLFFQLTHEAPAPPIRAQSAQTPAPLQDQVRLSVGSATREWTEELRRLGRALWAEALKLKGTLALWMCLIAPAVVVGLQTMQWMLGKPPSEADATRLWQEYGQGALAIWSFLMLPLFVTLESALLGGLEHSQRQWKHLLTLPISRGVHFGAKAIALFGLVLLAHLILLIVLIPLGGKLVQLHPAIAISGWPDGWTLLKQTGLVLFCASWMIAIHCFVALRWRSFTVAVSIGMSATVMGFIIGQSRDFGPWFPWTMAIQPLTANPNVQQVLLSSLLGALLTLWLALKEFSRREFAD